MARVPTTLGHQGFACPVFCIQSTFTSSSAPADNITTASGAFRMENSHDAKTEDIEAWDAEVWAAPVRRHKKSTFPRPTIRISLSYNLLCSGDFEHTLRIRYKLLSGP